MNDTILGVCHCSGDLVLQLRWEAANGEAQRVFWIVCQDCGQATKGTNA